MNMLLDKAIRSNAEEMICHLQQLVSIPSISCEAEGPFPFGKRVYQAYDYMMELGERKGFRCRNFQNYAGDITYGNPPYTGAAVHIDVVPAGAGWSAEPYGGQIADGRIYGRGTTDNKGCAIAVLYAMAAIKETALPMTKGIRLIVGCCEEGGEFPCLKHYMKYNALPDCGIVPDAFFPAVFAEKSFCSFLYSRDFDNQSSKKSSFEIELTSVDGGTAINVVPSSANLELRITGNVDEALSQLKAKDEKKEAVFEHNKNRILISFKGKSAHGARPELGDNAISKMLRYMKEISYGPQEVKRTISKLTDAVAYDTNGRGMGVCYKDVSGELTNNLGILKFDGRNLTVKMNIRCPVTITREALETELNKNAYELGMKYSLINYNPHFYIDKEDPLVRKLMGIYRQESGDYESHPISHGAGSYARAMKNFIPFGPISQEEEMMFHRPDENISIDKLLQITRIYAKALYALAK